MKINFFINNNISPNFATKKRNIHNGEEFLKYIKLITYNFFSLEKTVFVLVIDRKLNVSFSERGHIPYSYYNKNLVEPFSKNRFIVLRINNTKFECKITQEDYLKHEPIFRHKILEFFSKKGTVINLYMILIKNETDIDKLI